MYLFQITLPNGIGALQNPINKPELANIGGLVSQVINVLLILSAFLMLGWMSWGVFQYIFAGGNKEQLAKARQRLIYAVVGFLMVVIAFSVSRYVQDFFPTTGKTDVKTVREPK